jgi:hypothetical protein
MIAILILIQIVVVAMSVIALDSLRKEVNSLAKAHLDLIAVFQELLKRGSKAK